MTGDITTNRSARQSHIDVLKGIAIIMVIMVHF